jgi:hypothetical protein
LINYKDLFVAPSFDELEQVATDPFGNLKKLTESQLNSVWNKGLELHIYIFYQQY